MLLWKYFIRDRYRGFYLILFALYLLIYWTQAIAQWDHIIALKPTLEILLPLVVLFFLMAILTSFEASVSGLTSLAHYERLTKYPISNFSLFVRSVSSLFFLYLIFAIIFTPSFVLILFRSLIVSPWSVFVMSVAVLITLLQGLVLGLSFYLAIANTLKSSLKHGLTFIFVLFGFIFAVIYFKFIVFDSSYNPPLPILDITHSQELIEINLKTLFNLFSFLPPLIVIQLYQSLAEGQLVQVVFWFLILMVIFWLTLLWGAKLLEKSIYSIPNKSLGKITSKTKEQHWNIDLMQANIGQLIYLKEKIQLKRSPHKQTILFMNFLTGVGLSAMLFFFVGIDSAVNRIVLALPFGFGLAITGLNLWGSETKGLYKLLISPASRREWLWGKHKILFRLSSIVFASLALGLYFFSFHVGWTDVLGLFAIWIGWEAQLLALGTWISVKFPLMVKKDYELGSAQASLIGIVMFLWGTALLLGLNALLAIFGWFLWKEQIIYIALPVGVISGGIYFWVRKAIPNWLDAHEEQFFREIK